MNEKLIRAALAVVWVVAVQWVHSYLCKDLPPFHWAGFPSFLTGLAVGCCGTAFILLWEKTGEPT